MMIQGKEREYLKQEALLCCNIFLTEGQSALNKQLKKYNFADRLIIELLYNVYCEVKLLHISREEGRYRQHNILDTCEITD